VADITPSAINTAAAQLPDLTLSQAAAQQIAAIEAIIRKIPQQLATIDRQILLSGNLQLDMATQQAVFRTSQGDLQLQLPKTLFEQIKGQQLQQLMQALQGNTSNVYLRLTPSNQAGTATLLIDLTAPLKNPATVAAGQNNLTTAAVGTTNQNFTAFVMPQEAGKQFQQYAPAPQPGAVQASVPTNAGFSLQLKNFTQQIINLLQTWAPNLFGQPSVTNPAGNNPQSLNNLQNTALATPLKIGDTISVRLETLTGAALLRAANQTEKILGQVIAHAPNGQAIISAGDNTLFVRQQVNWPVGTKLLVSLPHATGLQEADLVMPGTIKPNEWPALKQLLDTLGNADPALRNQFVQNKIPQPNQQMGGALIFLMSAMRQGDMSGWIGEKGIGALDRAGKRELLKILTEELRGNLRSSSDTIVGEWRHYHLPFLDPQGLAALNIYVHRDPRQGHNQQTQQGDAAKQTRFLIDLNFTRLGAMQLDGFVQPKRFDLILRSANDLGLSLEKELQNIFSNTLIAIDYAGRLNFQHGRANWINFLSEQKSIKA
jgi:hypothetical protein